MTTAICEYCGKEFDTYPSWIKAGRKYCSNACRYQARRKRVLATCEYCGQEYETYPAYLAKGRRFCSWPCRNAGLRNRDRHICEACGKEFEVWPYQVSRGWGRFCSWKCRNAGMRGDKSQSWKGGIAPNPYPLGFSAKLRKKIRVRDGHACVVCGLAGQNVHHIDYNKKNNMPSNLVTLCSSCHGSTNHKRGHWQRGLSQIMIARKQLEVE